MLCASGVPAEAATSRTQRSSLIYHPRGACRAEALFFFPEIFSGSHVSRQDVPGGTLQREALFVYRALSRVVVSVRLNLRRVFGGDAPCFLSIFPGLGRTRQNGTTVVTDFRQEVVLLFGFQVHVSTSSASFLHAPSVFRDQDIFFFPLFW